MFENNVCIRNINYLNISETVLLSSAAKPDILKSSLALRIAAFTLGTSAVKRMSSNVGTPISSMTLEHSLKIYSYLNTYPEFRTSYTPIVSYAFGGYYAFQILLCFLNMSRTLCSDSAIQKDSKSVKTSLGPKVDLKLLHSVLSA